MRHFPKPFFRPKKDRWYVQLDGKQINLGPERDTAFERYHEIMTRRGKEQPAAAAAPPAPLVVSLLDDYLDWLQRRVADGQMAQRTYDWYHGYLQSFIEHIPPMLAADQLQPIHVYRWADSNPGWKTGKRGAMTAVQRAVNWAIRAGLFKSLGAISPIARLEKPAPGRREQLISEAEFAAIMALVHDRPFRDLLETAWDTGARPAELFSVEASYVDVENARWIFPIKQSKGRKCQRVVYLTDKALDITKRLCAEYATGPLFRNSKGERWTRNIVSSRFQRLRKKLGVTYSLYAIRHSWCTHALEFGKLDAVTVSVLMGHRDTQMISRHYAHLTQRSQFLREAARQAKGA